MASSATIAFFASTPVPSLPAPSCPVFDYAADDVRLRFGVFT
jgi:hypothetical protein